MTDCNQTELPLPFAGTIRSSTTKRFEEGVKIEVRRVGIEPTSPTIRFTQTKDAGPEALEPVEERKIEGLVISGGNRPFTTVTFCHPSDPKQIVTVVLEETDPRGEVDGVWIAEDDGGIDPET